MEAGNAQKSLFSPWKLGILNQITVVVVGRIAWGLKFLALN